MYNIFDYIRSILFNKKKIEINIEDNAFNLFLINRWISMYSPEMCFYINETANKNLSKIFSPTQQYDYLFNVIYKMPNKKINYIKKNKKEKIEKENNFIVDYAKNYELSQREIKNYLNYNNK